MQIPAWQFDEFQQVGRDYSRAEEADSYEADHTQFRDFDQECETIFNALHLKPGDTIIDLGAGTGAFAIRAAMRGVHVHAVDVSEAMLAHARTNAAAAGIDSITFTHAGFLTYSHAGPPADAITTTFAFHHLPDFWKGIALQRMRHMIKPGGQLYLFDVILPDDDPLPPIQAFIDRQYAIGGRPLQQDAEGHFREELSTYAWVMSGLLTRAGFTITNEREVEGVLRTYTCARAG